MTNTRLNLYTSTYTIMSILKQNILLFEFETAFSGWLFVPEEHLNDVFLSLLENFGKPKYNLATELYCSENASDFVT